MSKNINNHIRKNTQLFYDTASLLCAAAVPNLAMVQGVDNEKVKSNYITCKSHVS